MQSDLEIFIKTGVLSHVPGYTHTDTYWTLMHMCTLKGGVGLFNVVETNLGSSDPFT